MRSQAIIKRLLASCLLPHVVIGSSPSFIPALPPSYPLAVRNPYLSAWLPGDQASDLPSAVPQFWFGEQLTWSVSARIDGQVYSLIGVPVPGEGVKPATTRRAEYTATHTTFTLFAGSVTFVLDFLSPVAPLDYVRQSLPFSYLTVSATPIDGSIPNVQIYSDIDDSWAGQFGDVPIDWQMETSVADTYITTLSPGEGSCAAFSEGQDILDLQMAKWGTAVYCTRLSGKAITAAVGEIDTVRSDFGANGNLSTSSGWTLGGVAAYSHDLGSLQATTNVTFAIGLWREDAVNYMGTNRTGYFMDSCSNINAACVHVLDDFAAADGEARDLDATISEKANGLGGQNYSNIVSLSLRQAFGGMEITIPSDSLDTNDVMLFVKEISSDGNVNTIDVLFPMAPLLYIMAPEYIRLSLEPIMQYLATGRWPQVYMIHDIGANYPNATGHDDGNAEAMPLEECADLLLMVAMYHAATHNDDWVQQYQALFQQYADYLVANGLYPTIQLSSDDGAGPLANQTSLAIKSAIALNAYGDCSGMSNYSEIGRDFANVLYNQSAGVSSDKTHFTFLQGQDDTWHVEYNLYVDVLLGLDTFPASAYAMQTSYYPNVRSTFGLALDETVDWGKTDWNMFAAATAMAAGVNNTEIRDMFIDDVHAFMTNGQNAVPFSDRYTVDTGDFTLYMARPVVGGHFALMAMNGPNQIQVGGGRRR